MYRHLAFLFLRGFPCRGLARLANACHCLRTRTALLLLNTLFFAASANAVILWNDPATTLARDTGKGSDILGGSVKRDDTANDTLYFKFHVEPVSDKDTEDYFAAFELFDGELERLGVGNALKAWAYSAFFHGDEAGESNELTGYIDLHTLKPESSTEGGAASYQYPRHGVPLTIVFKIQYVPGEDDLVTVWLNPDLGPGANEAYQPEGLTTRFNANAAFDEIRLRHSGGGGGWAFSDLAIATAFSDFVDVSSSRPNEPGFAVTEGAKTFTFRAWQKEQGLPQAPVRALLQTRDDYLWIGSEDGLARFDGLRFVSFGVQEGFKGGPVTALCQDSEGSLWIGTSDSGLQCRRNNRFVTFTMRDGLPSKTVTCVAEAGRGNLWIGTEAGLRVLQNRGITTLVGTEAFEGRRINALLRDRQGGMWIGVQGAGIYHFLNSQFVQLACETPELLKDSHCLLLDDAGALWIGAGEDFVLCYENSKWRRFRIARNQAKAHISNLAKCADGSVLAGSAGGGLLQIKDGKVIVVPSGSGLSGTLVCSLFTDRNSAVWVGTEAGLNRLHRKSLFALAQAEGLGFGPAQGLAEVSPGVVWVGKPGGGLYRWDGKSFSRLSAAGLAPHDSQITTLLVTKDGFCWVATTNSLLLYKDPIAAADEVKVIDPVKPNIISLAEDPEGGLWLGTREGKIWQLHENNWLAITNFSQSNAVTGLLPDSEGSLWVGTDGNGLFHLNNGQFHHIDKIEGLSGKAIRALHMDSQGSLWIATADQGLSRWNKGRVVNFTMREGLPANNISQILEDDAGRLWLGCSGGIACVNKARLDEVVEGKIHAVFPRLFGRAEGMLSEECSGGFSPAGLKTRSGLLWLPTLKGVVVLNPRVEPVATVPTRTILEEVIVDGVTVPDFSSSHLDFGHEKSESGPVRITPGKHRVEFRYTGLNFDAADSIRFRYRLEGLDNDWVDAGTRRTAFYSYLPPGDYRFRLAASNRDGQWSESESAPQFKVLRHFWQSWWFIIIAGASFLFLLVLGIHFFEKGKLNRRLKRLEQERALERERTRIAQDLHDEMGAKLCRISFLSEHARRADLRPEELQDQIDSISTASREVLHSLDEIVWAVNPQNDTLEHVGSYIGQYAQEYFQMTGIECELDIPTQLPAHPLSSQARHHLFLATHEAITNILKHSRATHAAISMVLRHDSFEISISDNGAGFLNSGTNSGAEAATTGDGLSNMSRRLSEIGGNCLIDSTRGKGTQIRFIMPLSVATSDL